MGCHQMGFLGPNDTDSQLYLTISYTTQGFQIKLFRTGFGEYCNPPKRKYGDTILRIFLKNLFKEFIAAFR
jgi:hypothetical protein